MFTSRIEWIVETNSKLSRQYKSDGVRNSSRLNTRKNRALFISASELSLSLYLEQEFQSFDLQEKWSQDGGIYVQ
jgi:hypothetical protein